MYTLSSLPSPWAAMSPEEQQILLAQNGVALDPAKVQRFNPFGAQQPPVKKAPPLPELGAISADEASALAAQGVMPNSVPSSTGTVRIPTQDTSLGALSEKEMPSLNDAGVSSLRKAFKGIKPAKKGK